MRFDYQEVTLVEGLFGEPWDKEGILFHKPPGNGFWNNQKWKKKSSRILEIKWPWLIFRINSNGMTLRKIWKAQEVSSWLLTFLCPFLNLSQTLLLVPGALWILVNHLWWLSDWHSLNETHSHSSVTLSSHLHLNLFLWSCQLFFFFSYLQRFSSRIQERFDPRAKGYITPYPFSQVWKKSSKHLLCFLWGKHKEGEDGRIQEWREERKVQEWKEKWAEGRKGGRCFGFLYSRVKDFLPDVPLMVVLRIIARVGGMDLLAMISSTASRLPLSIQVTRELVIPQIPDQYR